MPKITVAAEAPKESQVNTDSPIKPDLQGRRRLLGSICVVVGVGALGARAAKAASTATVGSPAPAFQVIDSTNRPRTLAEFAGKTVVLEWTAPSCPFVRAQYESGSMQALQREATQRGVVWLSVLSTHTGRADYLPAEKAEAFNKQRNAAPTALLLDPTGAMGRAYGAVATPHMFVIAPDGRLAYAGAIDNTPTVDADVVKKSRNFVRAALDDLAAGRRIATPSTKPYGCTVGYAAGQGPQ
jgi:peroxiredoxin